MNVLSAMAGINNGEFCKKFTEQGVDLITLGGFNLDLDTFKAGLENMTNGRKEFINCPHHISEDISEDVKVIREYNPSWNGKISVNLRSTTTDSFKLLYANDDIDVFELNAHCRQQPMLDAGTGQALLHNTSLLCEMLEELTSNCKKEIGVKIRANVEGVNTLEIVEMINSYNVQYLHVDAMKTGSPEADYEIINRIASNTDIHIIGNNSVTTREDYEKMIENGASSVSVARAAQTGDITHIFQ